MHARKKVQEDPETELGSERESGESRDHSAESAWRGGLRQKAVSHL